MNSIDEVATLAKAVCLQDGYHSQMLIADGTISNAIMQFAGGLPDDANAKARAMLKAGAELSKANKIGMLTKIYFISEADMVMAKDTNLKIRPRFHPDRVDCLIISSLTPTGDSELITYEIKRDAANKIVALDERVRSTTGKNETGYSPLLQDFIVGFYKADKYTDEVLGVKQA
jgi:hypothetical protein